MLFEHLVITQIYHTAKSLGGSIRLSNYRTEHGAEVDLIVEHANGDVVAVECKSGLSVSSGDLQGFKSFGAFFNKPHRKIVVYGGTAARRIGDVEVLPCQIGLHEVFASHTH